MNESEYNAAAAREIAQCHEDIREKDAEIERLKTLEGAANASRALACQQMALAKDQIKRLEEALQRQDNVIIDKDAEIERLKSELRKLETLWFSENYRMRELLDRAADVLEDLTCQSPESSRRFISELRKAAE